MPKDKEFTYVQTEKEYQKGLAKGWNDDDMLRPGTYKFRRSRHIIKPKNGKTKISLYIDGDVSGVFPQTRRTSARRAVSNANQQRTAANYGK
jgi:hypothetical protein